MSVIEEIAPADFDAVMELTGESPFRSTTYINKAIHVMQVHNVDKVLGVIVEDAVFYKHIGSGLQLVGNDYDRDLLRFERDYLYRQCGGLTLTRKECYFDEEKRSGRIQRPCGIEQKSSGPSKD